MLERTNRENMNVNTNTEKILIIEDDNDINNLVAKALKSYGYECMKEN